MSSRHKIMQFAQIVDIKEVQAHEAKTSLTQGRATLSQRQNDEASAKETMNLSLNTWIDHLNAPDPDFVILGFQGEDIVYNNDQHRHAQHLVQLSECQVEQLSLACGRLNIELKQSQIRHLKVVTRQRKRVGEKAMSHIEDRITFDWSRL